jgi:hypothetical protein
MPESLSAKRSRYDSSPVEAGEKEESVDFAKYREDEHNHLKEAEVE